MNDDPQSYACSVNNVLESCTMDDSGPDDLILKVIRPNTCTASPIYVLHHANDFRRETDEYNRPLISSKLRVSIDLMQGKTWSSIYKHTDLR